MDLGTKYKVLLSSCYTIRTTSATIVSLPSHCIVDVEENWMTKESRSPVTRTISRDSSSLGVPLDANRTMQYAVTVASLSRPTIH